MSSLYRISANLVELMNMIDENEGEFSEECLLDTWEALDFAFNDKVEEWCKCIKNIDNEIENIKAEVKRLQERARKKEHTIIRMKSVLAGFMMQVNKPKVRTILFNVNRVKLNGKLDVDTKDVPKGLRKEQISLVPDNDKIRKLLDKGEKLGYARYYNSCTIQ